MAARCRRHIWLHFSPCEINSTTYILCGLGERPLDYRIFARVTDGEIGGDGEIGVDAGVHAALRLRALRVGDHGLQAPRDRSRAVLKSLAKPNFMIKIIPH